MIHNAVDGAGNILNDAGHTVGPFIDNLQKLNPVPNN